MSIKSALLCASLLLSAPALSQADVITCTFPEVNGPNTLPDYPGPQTDIATVNFTIPADQAIVSATLSGVFGQTSQFNGSTAPHQLLLDSVLVGSTADVTPDPFNNIVPFSFNVANLSVLLNGATTLSYIQTGNFVVRLSETTLTINTRLTNPNAVPEPGSVALLVGAGLSGLGLLASRRRRTRN